MSENKNNSNEKANETSKKIAGWGCAITALILFILFLICQNSNKQKSNSSNINYPSSSFSTAMEDEFWVINDDHIALQREPKTFITEQEFKNNVIVLLDPGTRVKIIESKGILSPWKKISVYNIKNQPIFMGWILANTVKNANKI